MSHKESAIENYKKGCSCAQSVFCAFNDLTGLDSDTAVRLSSPFGGGIAGMQGICGVLTGAIMVLGLMDGFTCESSAEEKKAFYNIVQMFVDEFKDKFGSMDCSYLKVSAQETVDNAEEDMMDADGFYKMKPCATYVEYVCDLLDTYLKEGNLE